MTIEEAIKILDNKTQKEELKNMGDCRLRQLETIYAAEQMAADELRKRQWISVKDRLPEVGQFVLITNGTFVCESFLALNRKWQRGGVDLFFMTATHWQPLPEPPKEG